MLSVSSLEANDIRAGLSPCVPSACGRDQHPEGTEYGRGRGERSGTSLWSGHNVPHPGGRATASEAAERDSALGLAEGWPLEVTSMADTLLCSRGGCQESWLGPGGTQHPTVWGGHGGGGFLEGH